MPPNTPVSPPIPRVRDMAPSRPPRPPTRPARDPKEMLKKRGADLIGKISDKDRYGIFLEPVDVDSVEGYLEVISRPMDLSTAQKNLQMGVYRTPMELHDDLELIWANCCTFNTDHSVFFKEAVRLRALAARYYDDLVRLLIRDGVAPALGLCNSRHNAPSSARMSQKRPPRHRVSSQNSDLVARIHSPSLQTSEPISIDADEDENESKSASASASAGQVSFRDVHLRRARANYDAAVTAAAGAAVEAKEAAKAAGFPISPPPSNKEIFSGPNGILRNVSDAPPVDVPPQKYPIMSNPSVRDSCCEIPIAWRRIGRWHSRGVTQSKFLSRERSRDVRMGRRYQRYVQKSAPFARRLLATILDAEVVQEHDLKVLASSQNANGCAMAEGIVKRRQYQMMKNSTSGGGNEMNGIMTDGKANGVHDGMEIVGGVTNNTLSHVDDHSKPNKRPRGKSEVVLPNGNCKNQNYTETAFGEYLKDFLGVERFSKLKGHRIDDIAESCRQAPQKNSIYRLRSLAKAKGIEPASVSDLLMDVPDKAQPCNDSQDIHPYLDEESRSNSRNMNHLLNCNYETMMNILRLRALRENADACRKENLEDKEREYVERLAEGMSRAVQCLPPHYVVHAVDAAESAAAITRSYGHAPNE